MHKFQSRLGEYLRRRNNPPEFQPLTPDASIREYYRISWSGGTAVTCVYPEPFIASEQSYLDVTELFRGCGLPVAKVLDFDEELGIIIIEDLGDVILRDALEGLSGQERENLIDRAIELIAGIQSATDTAFAKKSIASRLKFDVEKLNWELQYFKTHYFGTLRNSPLEFEIGANLDAEFLELSADLETRAFVLCHRDYHAANLMIDSHGELWIIDHQDARIGPVSYDLVSLLLDRVTDIPAPKWIEEKKKYFLAQRKAAGLQHIVWEEFENEFRLQTVQRCLKAVGTFSYQSSARGLTRYLRFIEPMFRISLSAIDELGRFPTIRKVLEDEVVRR